MHVRQYAVPLRSGHAGRQLRRVALQRLRATHHPHTGRPLQAEVRQERLTVWQTPARDVRASHLCAGGDLFQCHLAMLVAEIKGGEELARCVVHACAERRDGALRQPRQVLPQRRHQGHKRRGRHRLRHGQERERGRYLGLGAPLRYAPLQLHCRT